MVIFADIMEHKVITILILAFLLSHGTNGREKDPDEDKAYEFGFTIEGMQHRHEKKDVNGIIQGEFGFITADGVYHVTVYATDENGNFRIISMKNIKVSPPLDGSPDFGSTKYSPIPKAPQSQVSSPGSSTLRPVQVQKRTQELSTKAPVKAFTTKPTLKPACAGCGYVTTSKTPSILPNNNGGITGGTNGPSANLGVNDNRNSSPLLNRFSSNGQQNRVDSTRANERNPNGAGNIAQGGEIPNEKEISTENKYDLEQNNRNAPYLSDRFGGSPGGNQQNAFPERPSSYSDSFSNPPSEKNEIPGPPKQVEHSSSITHRNPEPPVKVSNGVIQIPGNPDIPIKDKYPGMVDGLPPGIEEKDITDILYRFNWTVGFQGHYETGYRNGAKIGGYFVNGSDGISRVVTYVADEFGYRPKVRIINIGLDSPKTPKDDKNFKLESFEFVWYPVK